MRLQNAEIKGFKLLLQFEADKKSEGRDYVVFKCRKTGGFADKELEYPISNVTACNKEYIAELSIDLSEQDFDGLYWDIYVKNAKKNKYEALVLDEEDRARVQKNAKKTEYWISDSESVRLYPTKDGKIFIKKVIDGVVLQKFDQDAPSLCDYINMSSSKPQGARYIELISATGDNMTFSLKDSHGIEDAETMLVLVSDRDGRLIMTDIKNSGSEYTVSMKDINCNDKENYRVYMAARQGGYYYYFRIRANRKPVEVALSEIYYDSNRYVGDYCVDSRRILLYTGASNDGLNIIRGDDAFCCEKKKGTIRIAGECEENYPFQFTMVIAVYNAEAYLGETIESLVNQDIGFKKNIQIVLVDDGSTDGSLEVCNYYADRYKGNIVVKHKENGGVSSTRNCGLELAEGRFINFMDSDDMLSDNTCSLVLDFFNKNYDKIDVVSIPINQFGAIEGPHWQNYKFFKGTRIIDLNKEYGITCMNSAASFIKNKVAKSFRFDESLDHAEDLKYMLQIVPLKMRIGVVAECEYKYRRYPQGVTSLVSSGKLKKNFYTNSLNVLVYETVNKYLDKQSFIPRFVQNTLMVDMQWKLRMKEIPEGVLSEEEIQEYLDKLSGVFKYIDDQVILTQKMLQIENKFQAIKLKYGYIEKKPIYKDIIYSVQNTIVGSASTARDYIEFIEISDDKLILEGYTTVIDSDPDDEIENYVSVGGVLYKCDKTNRDFESKNIFGQLMACVPYKVEIELNEDTIGKEIYLYTSVNGHLVARRNHTFAKFAPFNKIIECQYVVKGDYIIKKVKSGFVVIPYDENEAELLENTYIEDLIQYKEEKEETEDIEMAEIIGDAISLRKKYYDIQRSKQKEIWLVSDRTDAAGDNGEAFFRYLANIKPKDVDYYFVISEDSSDYEMMAKLGKVIPFGSKECKLYTLVADKIISAHAEEYIINPFGKAFDYVRNLINFKYVFLQHGITKDDLSGWLNKYNKNISLFVTAARAEYDSILNGKYYYTDDVVNLSGFPRFDRLISKKKPEKEIIIMPTWRQSLASAINPATGKRMYIKEFKDSEYYKFYQNMISDERLISALKKNGYKGTFVIHPSNKENACDFIGNDVISVCSSDIVYRDEFIKNSLLVTDYSSVAFDFAYLRKPVIYTQSDREEFFAEHTYDEGYFDYKKDGLGPVCESYEETIDEIIKTIENGCIIEKKYEERCNKFYGYNDNNNCKRVYEAIRKL